MGYEPNAEVDDEGNKKTQLSLVTRFLNNTGSVNYSSGTPVASNGSGAAVTFDDGPTLASVAGVASSTSTTTTTTTTTTSTTPASSPLLPLLRHPHLPHHPRRHQVLLLLVTDTKKP